MVSTLSADREAAFQRLRQVFGFDWWLSTASPPRDAERITDPFTQVGCISPWTLTLFFALPGSAEDSRSERPTSWGIMTFRRFKIVFSLGTLAVLTTLHPPEELGAQEGEGWVVGPPHFRLGRDGSIPVLEGPVDLRVHAPGPGGQDDALLQPVR